MRFLILLLLLISTTIFSQNRQLLYGFNEIPQTLLLNPGAPVNNNWFIGMPLLSNVHTKVGITGVTIHDLFADDNRDFNDKLRQAVYNMDANDHFAVNQQLDIFSGGFAFGKTLDKNEYLSFGLYQETDVFAYFPEDYAILVLEGNQNNIGRVFDLSDMNVRGEVISVLHVGYNKKYDKKLTAGIRGKLYSGIVNVTSTKNSGRFITEIGQDNFYNHIFDLNLQVQTSGLAPFYDDEIDNSDYIKSLKKRILLGGNMGLGVDVGFTYQPVEQWTIQASLQDIGFITYKKDVETYSLNGYYEYDGINPIFDPSQPGQTADDYWNEIKDDFENLFEPDTTYSKYTTWRPVKLNALVSYAFGKSKLKECNCIQQEGNYVNQVGAQLFMVKRPRYPQVAFTGFYYRRLWNQLRLKATYTIDSYSFSNIGLGMSAHLGGVNFYVLADNLLQYQNLAKAKSVSLQLGLNYIFNQK